MQISYNKMLSRKWKWKWQWPILGICALHLTHPKCAHTHSSEHTHTRSSGQPFMLRRPGSSCGFGALLKGTSVVVLRVKRALYIHSPHLQFLPVRDSNPQPLDYESESLTIRPRLPPDHDEWEHPSIQWTTIAIAGRKLVYGWDVN